MLGVLTRSSISGETIFVAILTVLDPLSLNTFNWCPNVVVSLVNFSPFCRLRLTLTLEVPQN